MVPYILSLGVMGEMGSTIVGVFTPFLLDRAPPTSEARKVHQHGKGRADKESGGKGGKKVKY